MTAQVCCLAGLVAAGQRHSSPLALRGKSAEILKFLFDLSKFLLQIFNRLFSFLILVVQVSVELVLLVERESE